MRFPKIVRACRLRDPTYDLLLYALITEAKTSGGRENILSEVDKEVGRLGREYLEHFYAKVDSGEDDDCDYEEEDMLKDVEYFRELAKGRHLRIVR